MLDHEKLIALWEWCKPYVVSGGFLTVFGTAAAALWKWLTSRNRENAEVNQLNAETDAIEAKTVTELAREIVLNTQTIGELNGTIYQLKSAALDKDSQHLADLRAKDDEYKTRGDKLLATEREIEECLAMVDRERMAIRRLFLKLHIPFWESDATGKTVYINQAWADMFNVTFETRDKWIEVVVEEDREKLVNEWRSRVVDQDAATNIGFRIKNKEGEIIHATSVYQTLRRRDGEIVKIIGVTIKK